MQWLEQVTRGIYWGGFVLLSWMATVQVTKNGLGYPIYDSSIGARDLFAAPYNWRIHGQDLETPGKHPLLQPPTEPPAQVTILIPANEEFPQFWNSSSSTATVLIVDKGKGAKSFRSTNGTVRVVSSDPFTDAQNKSGEPCPTSPTHPPIITPKAATYSNSARIFPSLIHFLYNVLQVILEISRIYQHFCSHWVVSFAIVIWVWRIQRQEDIDEFGNLESQNKVLQSSNVGLRIKSDQDKAHIAQLEQKATEFDWRIMLLTTTREEEKSRQADVIEALKHTNEGLQKQKAVAAESDLSQRTVIGDLTRQIQKSQAENARRMGTIQEEISFKNAEISGLQSRLQFLQTQNETQTSKQKAEVHDLEMTLHDKTTEWSKLKQNIESLENENAALSSAREDEDAAHGEAIEVLNNDVTRLKGEKSEILTKDTDRSSSYTSRIRELDETIQSLRRERVSLEEAYNRLSVELEAEKLKSKKSTTLSNEQEAEQYEHSKEADETEENRQIEEFCMNEGTSSTTATASRHKPHRRRKRISKEHPDEEPRDKEPFHDQREAKNSRLEEEEVLMRQEKSSTSESDNPTFSHSEWNVLTGTAPGDPNAPGSPASPGSALAPSPPFAPASPLLPAPPVKPNSPHATVSLSSLVTSPFCAFPIPPSSSATTDDDLDEQQEQTSEKSGSENKGCEGQAGDGPASGEHVQHTGPTKNGKKKRRRNRKDVKWSRDRREEEAKLLAQNVEQGTLNPIEVSEESEHRLKPEPDRKKENGAEWEEKPGEKPREGGKGNDKESKGDASLQAGANGLGPTKEKHQRKRQPRDERKLKPRKSKPADDVDEKSTEPDDFTTNQKAAVSTLAEFPSPASSSSVTIVAPAILSIDVIDSIVAEAPGQEPHESRIDSHEPQSANSSLVLATLTPDKSSIPLHVRPSSCGPSTPPRVALPPISPLSAPALVPRPTSTPVGNCSLSTMSQYEGSNNTPSPPHSPFHQSQHKPDSPTPRVMLPSPPFYSTSTPSQNHGRLRGLPNSYSAPNAAPTTFSQNQSNFPSPNYMPQRQRPPQDAFAGPMVPCSNKSFHNQGNSIKAYALLGQAHLPNTFSGQVGPYSGPIQGKLPLPYNGNQSSFNGQMASYSSPAQGNFPLSYDGPQNQIPLQNTFRGHAHSSTRAHSSHFPAIQKAFSPTAGACDAVTQAAQQAQRDHQARQAKMAYDLEQEKRRVREMERQFRAS